MPFNGSFEEGGKRLDDLTKELNRDDLTLEESTSLYREARELGEQLHRMLDEAELVVRDVENASIPVIVEQKANDHAQK